MRKWGNLPAAALAVGAAAILAQSCARHRPVSAPRPADPPVVAPTPKPLPRPVAAAELRGVWVSDPSHLNWDTATANLQRSGFNTMYVNFASGGAAFYPGSQVLPTAAGYGTDAFSKGIALAHRRGLAVHAKLIVMFLFKAPPEFQKQMVRANRVMRGPDNHPILQSGFAWWCPSQEANRSFLKGCVQELLTRYPSLDGLQFDYLRFSEQPSCFCPHCRLEFERSLGHKVRSWPASVQGGMLTTEFLEWRTRLIDSWAQQLGALARQTRPGLRVSCAVFSDLDRAREEKAQDWKAWLDRGYLDYVCTMTYTPDLREFERLVRKQQSWATGRGQLVVGIGSWKFAQMAPLSAEIDITRRLGAAGFALFSYDDAEARNFLPNLAAKN